VAIFATGCLLGAGQHRARLRVLRVIGERIRDRVPGFFSQRAELGHPRFGRLMQSDQLSALERIVTRRHDGGTLPNCGIRSAAADEECGKEHCSPGMWARAFVHRLNLISLLDRNWFWAATLAGWGLVRRLALIFLKNLLQDARM